MVCFQTTTMLRGSGLPVLTTPLPRSNLSHIRLFITTPRKQLIFYLNWYFLWSYFEQFSFCANREKKKQIPPSPPKIRSPKGKVALDRLFTALSPDTLVSIIYLFTKGERYNGSSSPNSDRRLRCKILTCTIPERTPIFIHQQTLQSRY